MKPNKVKSLIVSGFIGLMLLSSIGATTADAQRRGFRRHGPVIVYRPYRPWGYGWGWRDPFWDPFYSSRYQVVDPVAYQREKGYREGKDEGKDDAKKGRPANATGHKDYLKSGSIHFREAFVQGYSAGYDEKLADLREKGRD